MRPPALEASVPEDILLQPLRRGHAALFHRHGHVPQARVFRTMHRHQLRGQHVHPRHSQQTPVLNEGVQGLRRERQEHDGMVRGLQTAPAVQRERGDNQLRPDQGQRGRPQRGCHERAHRQGVRQIIRRQGVYLTVSFRKALRPRSSHRHGIALQHEAASDSLVRQDHASQEERNRIHQRHAQERGAAGSYQAPERTQLSDEYALRHGRVLLFRGQARCEFRFRDGSLQRPAHALAINKN